MDIKSLPIIFEYNKANKTMLKFDTIYTENYRWVLNLIKSRIPDRNDAEEMTNDVFLKVCEHLPNFDENKCSTGLLGWIRSFVWNKIIDYYRKKKETFLYMQDFIDEDGNEIFTITDPNDFVEDYCTKEFVNNVHKVIATLPNPYKKVATMFYIKDMSYDEIVEATQVTIGTIKGQLNRARKLLQTEFGNL